MRLRTGIAAFLGGGTISLTATEVAGVVVLGVTDAEATASITITLDELLVLVKQASVRCEEFEK